MKLFIALLVSILLAKSSFAATFYVATNGDDSNDCAAAQNPSTPKQSITAESGGISCLTGGNADILDIRAGTYSDRIDRMSNVPSGNDWSNATTIRAHSGETVT